MRLARLLAMRGSSLQKQKTSGEHGKEELGNGGNRRRKHREENKSLLKKRPNWPVE